MSKAFSGLQAPRKQKVILCGRNLRLVSCISDFARAATVVIAMPLHNQAKTLKAALDTALAQRLSVGHCAIVLLDDQSSDEWRNEIHDVLHHPALIILSAQCGSAASARNAILDFVESDLPNARWIARLDPDDLLCSEVSVESLRYAGENRSANFVLGSNFLSHQGEPVFPDNIANLDMLLDRERLTKFIEEFCLGRASNELPSCNLLIRAGQGIRYPLIQSAEDHWLVAQLLMFRPEHAAIVPYPVYCRYFLKGATTTNNERSGTHRKTREFLARAAKVWYEATIGPCEILGYGMEGCVLRMGDKVVKRFYPGAITPDEMAHLATRVEQLNGRIPMFEWASGEDDSISCQYDWMPLNPVGNYIPASELESFILDFARAGLVPCNIKRENLRLSGGRLIYIDIGRDIIKFSPSYLLDAAARLYGVGVMGLPDGELARRVSVQEQHESLSQLDGFDSFYRNLVAELYPMVQITHQTARTQLSCVDVTLMIKACPQDHASLIEQVTHIVGQLARPRSFSKVVIAIDPHIGSYLRQYATGDLSKLLDHANSLLSNGLVDDVWVAPLDPEVIAGLFERWFHISEIRKTHTHSGAPVFAQLWAFEQVTTRYVLQCDLDVLVGRKDSSHDYLSEMLAAIQSEKAWCVGFNIPKLHAGFAPYASTREGFVPEIRLGLLDLHRIRSNLPLPNNVVDGCIEKMWHRSMEDAQRQNGMESLRGGDDRTFYVHPRNEAKGVLDLGLIRDLVGQGHFPDFQAEHWDLVTDTPWYYPRRPEPIVFLLKGRNTPGPKLQRCVDSLLAQTDQSFGVILIDDASDGMFPWSLDEYIRPLQERTTLIRRSTRQGYIPNFLLASRICANPDAMMVVLDQDDVLMTTQVVTSLLRAANDGVDLVNGLMFRPNKPARLYLTDYENPRSKGGGNTWTHLRAFKKSLFESIPITQFMFEDDWIADVSDYATMIPMAEISKKPVQLIDHYYVWHDRPDYSDSRKMEQAHLIRHLLARPALHRST